MYIYIVFGHRKGSEIVEIGRYANRKTAEWVVESSWGAWIDVVRV